jgi:hypothetical protein
MASVLEREQRAAMGAPVFKGVDEAVFGAHDYDGRVTRVRGDIISRRGKLGLKAQIIPGPALEYCEYPSLFAKGEIGGAPMAVMCSPWLTRETACVLTSA